MLKMGKKVKLAMGSEINIRLTTREDILLFESLFAMKQRNSN